MEPDGETEALRADGGPLIPTLLGRCTRAGGGCAGGSVVKRESARFFLLFLGALVLVLVRCLAKDWSFLKGPKGLVSFVPLCMGS